MRFVGLASAELSPASIPDILRPAVGAIDDERMAFVAAIAAARMYHVVAGAKTVYPGRKVVVEFEPMFGTRRNDEFKSFCVCEQLTTSGIGGSWRTSCVTRLPRMPRETNKQQKKQKRTRASSAGKSRRSDVRLRRNAPV